MPPTFTKTVELEVQGSGLTPEVIVRPVEGVYQIELDMTAQPSDNQSIQVDIPMNSQLMSFVAALTTSGVTEGVSLRTNSTGDPDDEFPLTSVAPVMWDTYDPAESIFSADVESLILLNTLDKVVKAKVRILLAASD